MYAYSAHWADRNTPAVTRTGRALARSSVQLADSSEEIIKHCARGTGT